MQLINPGIALMLIVSVFQSAFVVIVKMLGAQVSTSVTVLSYYLIPLMFFSIMLFKSGQLKMLVHTDKFIFHFIRGFFTAAAVFCFFYAANNIDLGATSILFNTAPIFIPILARFFINEHTSRQAYLGIAISLVGVVVIIHPGFGGLYSVNSLIGLASGILMAISQVMLRYLAKEKGKTKQIVFYLYLTSAIWSVIFVVLGCLFFRDANILQISLDASASYVVFMLLLMGLLSLVAQRMMTLAFSYMPAAKLVTYLYVSVPVSALFGWIGWQQRLDIYFYVGVVVIFSGVLVMSFDKK